MKKVKLAVVGSRTFNDYALAVSIINKIAKENDYEYVEIISGGAKGADTFGEQYANINKIPTKIFYPDWKKYGKKAGFLRNVDIIRNCDICICFWDGQSHGAKHDIDLCKEYNKICYTYNFITNTFI